MKKKKIVKGETMEEEQKYYWNHFEEIMVSKIDNYDKLTERELRNLVDFEIEREYGDSGRWTQSVQSIVKLCDRFFVLDWYAGLTEYQENEFYDQPYEVKKHTYDKTITVTEWIKIN